MPEDAPDIYTDQFLVSFSVWGAALSFLKGPAHPAPGQAPQAERQVTVRMSLEHAKAMTMILRKSLKGWERENVEITIPHSVLNAMQLSVEDW